MQQCCSWISRVTPSKPELLSDMNSRKCPESDQSLSNMKNVAGSDGSDEFTAKCLENSGNMLQAGHDL